MSAVSNAAEKPPITFRFLKQYPRHSPHPGPWDHPRRKGRDPVEALKDEPHASIRLSVP